MNKTAIKHAKAAEVGMTISDPSLVDLHRFVPKSKGGKLTEENTTIVTPEANMRFHGNYREREEALENLKSIIDDRNQVMKVKLKVENQLRAYKRRTDNILPDTVKWLEEQLEHVTQSLTARSKLLRETVRKYAEFDHLAEAALNVTGVGEIVVAYCLVYIDIGGVFPEDHPRAGEEKARHVSSVWKYVGLHTANHKRYTKGESSGGNKNLRTALYNGAVAHMKCRKSAYRVIYDQVKDRLSKSNKITTTRISKDKFEQKPWKDVSPGHRHGSALRAVAKHFIADWWYVGRDLMGLSNGPCYAEAQLGSGHRTVNPGERGWVW